MICKRAAHTLADHFNKYTSSDACILFAYVNHLEDSQWGPSFRHDGLDNGSADWML